MRTTAYKKYRIIADQIFEGIRAGAYPIGSLLPTESRLMEAYGVSRQTVRSALQDLRVRGVIESRQGSGSIVIAQDAKPNFVERVQSIDELIRFGRSTGRRLLSHRTIAADAQQSEIFGSAPGRSLLEIHLLRTGVERPNSMVAYVTLWIDPLFSPLVADLERENTSVAELFDSRFQRRARSVRQFVSAGQLDPEKASAMQRTPGECALIIERRYSEHPESPAFLQTVSVCVAEMVTLESRFLSV